MTWWLSLMWMGESVLREMISLTYPNHIHPRLPLVYELDLSVDRLRSRRVGSWGIEDYSHLIQIHQLDMDDIRWWRRNHLWGSHQFNDIYRLTWCGLDWVWRGGTDDEFVWVEELHSIRLSSHLWEFDEIHLIAWLGWWFDQNHLEKDHQVRWDEKSVKDLGREKKGREREVRFETDLDEIVFGDRFHERLDLKG